MPQAVDHNLFVRLSRSRDFLAASAQKEVVLADAAAEAYLSKFHYLREFQRAFGETPHQFLQRRRIELARHLLASTEKSVTEICFEVGYQSHGSFSTLFRQATGCSPTRYRERSRRRFVAIRWAPEFVFIPSCFLAHYGLELTSKVSNFQEAPVSTRLAY